MHQPKKPSYSAFVGILIAGAALIIAVLTWLVPFDPVGPSPVSFQATPTVYYHQTPGVTTMTIYANKLHSGSSAGGDLLSFEETTSICGPGDTPEDSLVKSFLSFYLGDIYKGSTITHVNLRVPCAVDGNPEVLGPLVLAESGFGVYEPSDFHNATLGSWNVTWTDVNPLIETCKGNDGAVVASGNRLVDAVQASLQTDWIQFVFYFSEGGITANQRRDAIILRDMPIMVVKYRE